MLGSRDAARAEKTVLELVGATGGAVRGAANAEAAAAGDIVLVVVPWEGHGELLRELKPTLSGKIDDDSLIPAAVEEALRLESPVPLMGRTLVEDVEIDGVETSAGDKVALMFGMANHYESKFDSPHSFDLYQSDRHVAFGHGIHRCIGEHLARAEMRIALKELLQRIPQYRIAGEVEMLDNSVMNRSLKALKVTF